MAVRLLKQREKLAEPGFALVACAFNRARALHPLCLDPVKAGLVSRAEDRRWWSYNEYAGMSAEEKKERCGLSVDRVRIPSDLRARI